MINRRDRTTNALPLCGVVRGMKEYTVENCPRAPSETDVYYGRPWYKRSKYVHHNTGVLGVPLWRRGDRDLSGDANGGETGVVKNTGRGCVSRPLPADGIPDG